MSKLIIREILPEEREKYNQTVNHILQSYEWGEFRENSGIKIVRLGVFDNQKIINGLQLTIHFLPKTNFTIGYLPRPKELTSPLIEAVTKIGKENNCIFIKIESSGSGAAEQRSNQAISNSILPRYTFHLDLTQSEDEIMKKMHEKTRYNIRLAQRHGLLVRQGESLDDLKIFLRLQKETAKRQNFEVKPHAYFQKMWKVLEPKRMLCLLICHLPAASRQPPDTSSLSSILLFRFKDILYYPYGGSSTLHREMMPNHLLHWEAIKLGKKLGCKVYDFWGAYKNKAEVSDPWYGIYRFKSGFGGKIIEHPQSIDLVFNSSVYKLYKLADSLRWRFLRMKTRFFKFKQN